MYLFPWVADRLVNSDLTHRWLITLGRSGYNPLLGALGGGAMLALTTIANIIWYQRFDGRI